jgi:hypothetical protein
VYVFGTRFRLTYRFQHVWPLSPDWSHQSGSCFAQNDQVTLEWLAGDCPPADAQIPRSHSWGRGLP